MSRKASGLRILIVGIDLRETLDSSLRSLACYEVDIGNPKHAQLMLDLIWNY